ncbi:MAG: tetratricopeptide repeat protein, partial [Desulfobulbaceae bacterium]|nr:tetratricopeptide repeat protein [Desulfobulbaceae bacterium]
LIPKEELAERRHKVPLERFEWPLAAGLLILVLELLVGERKKPPSLPSIKTIRSKVHSRVRSKVRGAKKITEVTTIILLLSVSIGTKAYCSKGEEAFERGDYLQASEYYREKLESAPGNPELNYNFGTASFKNNMYDDAIEAFTKALKSDDIELQRKAYYNRGNSNYQKGVELQQADPKATIDQWKQALSSLQAALELAPDDVDAKYNHEVIEKRLEELEKQQQQNQQNEQDQQDNKQDGDSDDQQQDNGSQQDKNQQEPNPDEQQSNAEQPGEKQDSEKNEQEDNQQPPQPSEGNEAETDEPKPINESQDEEKNPGEQAKQDALRQQLGKMTREEAEKLLNALKNEEGELNFVPAGHGNNENDVDKDW